MARSAPPEVLLMTTPAADTVAAADRTEIPADPALSAAADLHDAGDLGGAEAAYRRLLVDRPDDPAVTVALGDVLADAGRAEEATALYRRVVDAAPDAPASADAYDGLAAVLQDAGQIPDAVAASLRAIELRADADDAYRLGFTLEQMGRMADADRAYAVAADLRPAFAEAQAKLGQYLLRQDKPADAARRYALAADAGPAVAEIHCNLAHARRLAGDEDGALKSVRRAIDLKPDLAAAHNVLGGILKDRRRPSEALLSFRRALEINPEYAEAVNNYANVLESIGRVAEAAGGYERAVALAPNEPRFHENLGLNRLLRGDLPGGWPEADWRRRDRRNPASRPFPQPLWDGRPLSGQTILLTAEQGLGDSIHFLRYAPMVAARGGRVVVECQAPLVALARTVAGVADVVAQGDPLPPFACHCPLMTLPLVFGTTLASVPAAAAYLGVDAGRATAWADRLPKADGRRVGLVWAGNPKHANDATRSIKPARLAPLAKVPGVTWVSLQKTPTAAPPPAELKLVDLTADLADFADTAALIQQLDLVIAADTSVAHLAAALGKPTWVMISAVPDWRWLLGRADSPWYPSVRLFRQATPGDWAGVAADVAAALAG